MYAYEWNSYHCIRVLYQLYKANVLTAQGVYKVVLCEGCQSIFDNSFFFFVLPSKDCTLSWHTFLYHTVILCTLFNLHMTIQILIPLIMFEGKFCFYIFHYFVNQTNGNMVNLPMGTHWVEGIWNLGHCRVFTLSVQGKYTNYTKVYVQDYHLWRNLSDSEKVICLFPLIDDRWNYSHTLVKHTFISCTLSNLYKVI